MEANAHLAAQESRIFLIVTSRDLKRSWSAITLSLYIDQLLHLSHILNRGSQIHISILGDQEIVLNPHTSNIPILVEHIKVDVCSMDWVPQVWLDDEPAEVDLGLSDWQEIHVFRAEHLLLVQLL